MTTKKEYEIFIAGIAVGIGVATLYGYCKRNQFMPFAGIERVSPNAGNIFRAALFQ